MQSEHCQPRSRHIHNASTAHIERKFRSEHSRTVHYESVPSAYMVSPRPRASGDSLQITIHPADDQAHVRGLDFQLGRLVRRLSRIDPTVQSGLFV
jgi:hypothetical protein